MEDGEVEVEVGAFSSVSSSAQNGRGRADEYSEEEETAVVVEATEGRRLHGALSRLLSWRCT